MVKAEFKYTPSTGKLDSILKKITESGSVPAKADTVWLGMNGAGKSNDRTILTVFKFVGLIDSSDTPTATWRALRVKDGAPLAQGIRAAYKELYDMDYNAHEKSDQELEAFFKKKVDSGDRAIQAVVNTYRAVCKYANFNGQPTTAGTPAAAATPASSNGAVAADGSGTAAAPAVPQTTFVRTTPNGVQVTINIQVALHETQDAEVYKSFFKAMKDCFLS